MDPLFRSPSRDSLDTSDSAQNILTATFGEFVGTFMFLLLAFSVTQIAWEKANSSAPDLVALVFISLAFAASLTVNLWMLYRISGAAFNPAVTFALALVGEISIVRAIVLLIAQFVAGIAAAGIASALFPGPLQAATRLGHGTSIAQGVFIEFFLTAELVFAVLMLAVLKHKATYLAPIGIGLTMFIAHLSGFYYTGASLNPARSLGPDIIVGSFPRYAWIYFVGPGLGALLAVLQFWIFKSLRFDSCNPDQDSDGRDDVSSFFR